MKKIIFLLILIFSLLVLSHSEADATLNSAGLLRNYESNYQNFNEIEIGDKLIYFQERMVDNAIVEKDFKVYQFDKKTGELTAKKTHWRTDLPEHLPSIKISKEQAETMVKGQVQFTKLYILSPESDVFSIKPTPKNPCWIVRSINKDNMIVTIIDAVEGKILGYGVPPPYNAFSLTGPNSWNPCNGSWAGWSLNASSWFNRMGYKSEAVEWPTKVQVKSYIQSANKVMFYEFSHGASDGFNSGCLNGQNYESIMASEIKTWITSYEKMPFTFIGSCDGMCATGNGTLSYEFRKGSTNKTVTVGYCGMGAEKCSNCFTYSLKWQDALFNYMNQGLTLKAAFDQTQMDFPACATPNNCMRFVGDENFKVIPVLNMDVCHQLYGASPQCEGMASGTTWCDDYIQNKKNICNLSCQYSYQNCRTGSYDSDGGANYTTSGTCTAYQGCSKGDCKYTTYYDTCQNYNQLLEAVISGSSCTFPFPLYYCPYGCISGKCNAPPACPILKAWNGSEFKEIGLLNIHAPAEQDTTYTSGFTMQEKDGKYELVLHEAAYHFWDGSHIDSVKLVNSTGKDCHLISAIHSKDGDVLKDISKSDDIRVRTYPGDEIKLVYDGCSGNDFTFTIEGYNMKTASNLNSTPRMIHLLASVAFQQISTTFWYLIQMLFIAWIILWILTKNLKKIEEKILSSKILLIIVLIDLLLIIIYQCVIR